jgi:Protein of unknown function (DUF1566)/Caspase domain
MEDKFMGFGMFTKRVVLSLVLMVGLAQAEFVRIDEKEVVVDTDKNLMWQDDSDSKIVSEDWQGAVDYCQELNFAEYSDWRLPNIDTLKALYPNKDRLYNMVSGQYWSSSPNVSHSPGAWLVFFNHGLTITNYKSNSYAVRCVRDSKTLKFDSLSSFSEYFKASKISGDSVSIVSSNATVSNEIFIVIHNDKTYKGTKESILAQLDTKSDKNPFIAVQQLTQKNIDIYLIPRQPINISSRVPAEIIKPSTPNEIAKPSLPPMPLLVKDEFETKAMFDERVKKIIAEREVKIVALQDEYRRQVDERNAKIERLNRTYQEQVSERNAILMKLQKEYEIDIEAIKNEQLAKKAQLPQKVKEFTKLAFAAVMESIRVENPRYDAENELMYIDIKATGAEWKKQVALKVAIGEAKSFKDNIASVKPEAEFTLTENGIILKEIRSLYNGKSYMAVLSEKDFKPETVKVALQDNKIEFNAPQTAKLALQANTFELKLQNPNLTDKFQVSAISYSDGKQASSKTIPNDLTTLIKNTKSKTVDNKKWLFAVAVENYDEADKVIFAKISAEDFIATAQKKFGISDRNTYKFIDEKATTMALTDQLNRFLTNISDGDTVYFYYSGHGIPSPEDGEAYFLPKDKIVDFVVREKELMAAKIYEKLGKSKAGSVIAFVDACFSGKTDNISNFKGIAGGILKSKRPEFDKSKMAVISAGSQKQFSNSFDEKGHRLFTYFLTKNILESENLDLDLLYKKTATQVKEISWKKGDVYLQEPTIEGNARLKL